VLEIALQRAHLLAQHGLLGVALPGLRRPGRWPARTHCATPEAARGTDRACGSTRPAPLRSALRSQARRRTCRRRSSPPGHARRRAAVVPLPQASRRQLDSVAWLMPYSAASALSERLCGGSMLRSTASLRSSVYLGTDLPSCPLLRLQP